MALRAIKPESVQKRLKCLFYGNAGVGKTTAALAFPKVYLIDTEKGAENSQYTEMLSKNGGVIFQTTDFDEMLTEVTSLLTEKHEYKTLVIDPLTTVYNELVERIGLKTGTEFGRHISEANKQMKHLCMLLLRLDMNVIITAHAKNEYGTNMAVLGNTYDCYKKLDYLFDLVFEIQKRGAQRVAVIKKSRISTLPDGESFEFSYDALADKYGRDVLERDAVSQELATNEEIAELNRLISMLKIPPETWKKWLDKSDSETFAEMPRDNIKKCIQHLTSKIPQSTGEPI